MVMANRQPVEFLRARVEGTLKGAYTRPGDKIGALYGMLSVAPQLLPLAPGLLEAIDAIISISMTMTLSRCCRICGWHSQR